MGEALKGIDCPLVVTSGTSVAQKGKALVIATDVATEAAAAVMPCCMSELGASSLSAQGVHVSVVWHPLVHGKGDHGFIVAFIGIAAEKGVSGYLGDGLNVYSSAHNLDVARLYRLILEKGEAGKPYHAVAEEALTYKDIAQVVGRRLSVPTEPVPASNFGWMAMFAGLSNRCLSRLRRSWDGHPSSGVSLLTSSRMTISRVRWPVVDVSGSDLIRYLYSIVYL